MPQFKATRRYRVIYGEKVLVFAKGDVVELDEATAAWVERDSPGTLQSYVLRRKRVMKRPPQDRMVLAAETRSEEGQNERD